jgi:hypothetical protein
MLQVLVWGVPEVTKKCCKCFHIYVAKVDLDVAKIDIGAAMLQK